MYPKCRVPLRVPLRAALGAPFKVLYGLGFKGPCAQTQYILWPQCTYIGSTLRPKYILFGYMDP